SFVEANFMIMPQCRLVYMSFVPDWGTFNMETQRKPLSGFSRFPINSSKMQIGFAGLDKLVMESFDNFGMAGYTNEISKKIYYQYLVQNRIFKGTFEELFPKAAGDISLLQTFVIDLKDYMSAKSERLNFKSYFSGATSPPHYQIVVISVHTNGNVTCKASKDSQWTWTFNQGI
ncbi:MAG: hypothetical protein Q8O46_00015, partial [bacterium]|nr:hypothetical protein [bacterium]